MNQERETTLRRLHAEGLTDRAIGQRLGLDRSTICNWRRQWGIPAQPNSRLRCRQKRQEAIRQLVDQGLTDGAIGRRLGLRHSSVRLVRQSLGLAPQVNFRHQGALTAARSLNRHRQSLATDYGLPAGLRLREVQIVITLAGVMMATRARLTELLGVRMSPYLETLIATGLVTWWGEWGGVRRLPKTYLLTPYCLGLLARGGQHARH